MERIVPIDHLDQAVNLFGSLDENIKIIEKSYGVSIALRGEEIKIQGDEAATQKAANAVAALLLIAKNGEPITDQSVRYAISLADEDSAGQMAKLAGKECICITSKGNPVKPKTLGQKAYVDAIRNNTVVIGVGPAGTGKTYLAVALAVAAFRDKQVSRIILTRPAVEAGEKLGFLPGDLQSKVDPYLRPLYDALFEMLGAEAFARCMEKGSIEVAPLAYMRGRTLDDSFIILDEAQNTTPEQMKMFMTRLGFHSKIVVTGDSTQVDLPDGKTSGLIEVCRVLKNIEDVQIIQLNEKDVVRHQLVQRIVKAYEKYEQQKKRGSTHYAKNESRHH